MTAADIKARVEQHAPVPGIVGDDTETFQVARDLAANHGWDLEITTIAQSLDDETRTAAFGENARLSSTDPAEHGKQYQWPYEKPNEQRSFFADDNTRNCATYPQMLGLCVPEPSGQLVSAARAASWRERSAGRIVMGDGGHDEQQMAAASGAVAGERRDGRGVQRARGLRGQHAALVGLEAPATEA